jgi:formate--tetrahydrofolate ligase
MRTFHLPVIVAINGFLGDTEAERIALRTALDTDGITAVFCTHWADGSAGAADLARHVIAATDAKSAHYAPLYPDDMPIAEKLRTLVRKIYGGDDIDLAPKAARQIAKLEARGYGNLPVCMAKTQYSFTADPTRRGAPTGFTLPIREIRLSAGAGFVVALAGDVLTMPGLPRVPAADSIGVNAQGEIFGIF